MNRTINKNPASQSLKETRRILLNVLALKIMFILMLVLTASYAAQAGNPPAFEIPWFTFDGGGAMSQGGTFTVAGTIGQPDTGVMTGGGFDLSGGFWAEPIGGPSGDCNDDGTIDLDDYFCFYNCVLGPGQGLLPNCGIFDYDNDGDVDLEDSDGFLSMFGN